MSESGRVSGAFVDEDGLAWYRIDNHDLLDPFLVSLVTPDDQWAFISTSGALTAGRGSAEQALFPYETDDRLHRSGGRSGPLTLIRIDGVPSVSESGVWQPFAPDTPLGLVERSVAKTTVGDRLRFTERHPELGLTFTYTWATAGRFGLARSCRLSLDDGQGPVAITILDGLVDVLPAGVELATQQTSSTLVDGYRRNELHDSTGLALFTLEALISDRPDPAEALRTNVVWSTGLDQPTILLSERQIRRFRSGFGVTGETVTTGIKGSYLQSAAVQLHPGHDVRWTQVADVALDHTAVTGLIRFLNGNGNGNEGDSAGSDPVSAVTVATNATHRSLIEMVSAADGGQVSADRRATVHHFANVAFNCMRGGIFLDEHRVSVDDVGHFVGGRDSRRRDQFDELTADLDPVVDIETLRQAVSGDDDIRRLVNEYLPLSFSRRHGDPSRPWNTFRIPAPRPDGRPALGYQGNWRDIFQNWEALLHSYPLYAESIISKFLNASTVDGNNPYRITDDGVDWEVPEDGSWGNFGYWGDHQIVYLHRLLVAAERFHPGLLESMMGRRGFSYADVPYRLRSYEDLVRDAKHTLDFDDERQALVNGRVAAMGGDGRLVPSADGTGVHLATMAEKLLVPALAKLSNLVAGGGIWMNTQRPEWNDANNALVGNGLSMVTLFHLREYLRFLDGLLTRTSGPFPFGRHVAEWLRSVTAVLAGHDPVSAADATMDRRRLLDALGLAYEHYRTSTYRSGPGDQDSVTVDEIRELVKVASRHLDMSASRARRSNGLVHTYSLLRLDEGEAHVEPLYEMLEGQVAALSSSSLESGEVLALVSTLFDGKLHRADQASFMLYPDRRPPGFLDKNLIPSDATTEAVIAEAEHPSGLVIGDEDGRYRFAAHIRSARVLEAELDGTGGDRAGKGTGGDGPGGRAEILAAYEAVFNHRAFTGRSQSMYRYEGLGSIYWHMVSKLLFAVQERVLAAVVDGSPATVVDELVGAYQRIRSGLGFMKSAELQGTFPTDPHSHTPAGLGAQQPGMTGQVKEGVLLRWAELGVHVRDGRLRFEPLLLDPSEFLAEPTPWSVDPVRGSADEARASVPVLAAGSLGFTYCGVPVVYSLGPEACTEVIWAGGRPQRFESELDGPSSRAVFARAGEITRINVVVPPAQLLIPGTSPTKLQRKTT